MVMEHHFLRSLLVGLIVFIISLPLRYFFYLIYKAKPSSANEAFPFPPGTTGWPLIGETLDYLSKLRNGVFEKFVSERRNKYGTEVFMTSLIGYPMAILCGAEGNKFLFTNENKLVQLWFPKSVEKIFPKYHDKPLVEDVLKVGKSLSAFIRGPALQNFVGTIDVVTKHHLQAYWDGEQVKVHHLAGQYTLGVACRLLLSVEDPRHVEKLSNLVQGIGAGILSVAINLPGTPFHRTFKASKALHQELLKMFEERKIDLAEKRATPTQDILSHMLLGTDDDGRFFNEGDIASFVTALLHAGFDPLRTTVTFIVKYLAEFPDVYHHVLTEQMEIAKLKKKGELLSWEDTRKMKYSWSVANEVLRLMPPVVGTFREAITDFTYAGHLIPKGTKIHWNSHSTQKDPKYFPNPEKFDPSRFLGKRPPPYTFIPFGGGPRMCPATKYAKLIILVFMHNVVTKFKWEKLIPNEKVVFDPHPRPTQGLPIRLHPRIS